MYKSYSGQNLLPPKIQKNIQRNSTSLNSESYVILNWYPSLFKILLFVYKDSGQTLSQTGVLHGKIDRSRQQRSHCYEHFTTKCQPRYKLSG